ncbi:hypothetical protein ANN_26829 [Periplaneta americana]|uniref:Uncharacterized protein n=1 Tax=Periplaneta americana TaxID=6978 RepID=A0ABQ8RZC9_PERAM|nr:hypothetical protein ANN_26829 [Periplaneta americana]
MCIAWDSHSEGYNLSYITDEDMSNKISKFIKITGVINAVFKSSHVQKHTRLKDTSESFKTHKCAAGHRLKMAGLESRQAEN